MAKLCNCGETNADDSKFCIRCGTNIEAQTMVLRGQSAQAPSVHSQPTTRWTPPQPASSVHSQPTTRWQVAPSQSSGSARQRTQPANQQAAAQTASQPQQPVKKTAKWGCISSVVVILYVLFGLLPQVMSFLMLVLGTKNPSWGVALTEAPFVAMLAAGYMLISIWRTNAKGLKPHPFTLMIAVWTITHAVVVFGFVTLIVRAGLSVTAP